MRKHLWESILLVAALTAGCATRPEPVVQPAPLPLKTFIKKWATNIETSSGKIARVYVREDLVFAYTTDGTSYVCSRENGTLLHLEHFHSGLGDLHAPVVYKDVIVYPTINTLEIYERKTGRFTSSVELPSPSRSDAVGSRNLLLIAVNYAAGGRLVCMDLNKAYVPQKWGLMFPGGAISSTPAAYLDVVYAAGEDGKVTAVGADNRVPVWDIGFFQTDGAVYAPVAADDTGVYVAGSDSKLYCLNRNSGKVKWQYYASYPLRAMPALTKDLVLEAVPQVGLVALDKLAPPNDPKNPQYNRQPKWIAAGMHKYLAEDETYVYCESDNHGLVALDRTTGTVEFQSKRHNVVASGVNTKDGVIFVATRDNRLMAVTRVIKAGTVGEEVEAEPNGMLGALALAGR